MLTLEITIGKLCDAGGVSACKKNKDVCLVIRTSIVICVKISDTTKSSLKDLRLMRILI